MNRSLILFMLLVFCCISCKKYEPDLMESYTLNASGLRNGKPWKATATLKKMLDNNLLNLVLLNKFDYEYSENVFFADIDTSILKQHIRQLGKHEIGTIVSGYSMYYMGDLYAKYDILDDNDTSNNLKILSQENGFSKNIKLQFSATFILKGGGMHDLSDKVLYPDTLRFENIVVDIDAID